MPLARRDILLTPTVRISCIPQYPAPSHYHSDFNPTAVMFSPHHYGQIIMSDVGVFIWAAAVAASMYRFGFFEVFRTYLVPYRW